MKALTVVLILALGLFGIGCSDDNPTEPPPAVTPTVTVYTGTTPPNMTSTTDSVWNRITPATITLSSNQFSSVVRQAGSILSLTGSVAVQAVVVDDTLYVRLSWSDDSFDSWPGQYQVTGFDTPGSDTLAHFTRDDLSHREDQAMLLFRPTGEVDWDVWNWRVITTGLGGLAEGFVWTGTSLTPDAGTNPVAYINDYFGQPVYMFEDSPTNQSPYMYVADTVPLQPNVDSVAWTMGDLLPGYYIDDSLALPSHAAERGSRFDVFAIGEYDHGAAQYDLVLKRALNTGNSDDLNLTAYEAVDLRIGIANNADFTLSTLYTRQGFTSRIILNLP